MYVNGVDTAIKGKIDRDAPLYFPPEKVISYFDNIPGATPCFFVHSNKYCGGWYHSPIQYLSDTLMFGDKVPVHLDFSRQPFVSVAQKDSMLNARVAQLHKSLSNDDSLPEGTIQGQATAALQNDN